MAAAGGMLIEPRDASLNAQLRDIESDRGVDDVMVVDFGQPREIGSIGDTDLWHRKITRTIAQEKRLLLSTRYRNEMLASDAAVTLDQQSRTDSKQHEGARCGAGIHFRDRNTRDGSAIHYE